MDLFFTLGKAFLVGGIFCAVGQILIDKTKLTPARILVGYVVMGVLLSALGLYQPIVDFAGAGATVPLTGFGHLLATGVQKAVAEKGLLGALTGGLSAAAAGITAAMIVGLLGYLSFLKHCFFSSKKSPPVLKNSTGGESFEYQVLPRRERNFKIKSRTQKVSGRHL